LKILQNIQKLFFLWVEDLLVKFTNLAKISKI
jgi:hypothetical protein